MRIEFLNDSLTEARVTRGWWRWKRVAVVKQAGFILWHYASGDEVDRAMSEHLSMFAIDKREAAKRRQEQLRNWQPLSPLPQAKAVRK
jgi:hypothetical protein